MEVVKTIFEECRQIEQEGILEIELSGKSGQRIRFVPADDYRIEISLITENKQHEDKSVALPNLNFISEYFVHKKARSIKDQA